MKIYGEKESSKEAFINLKLDKAGQVVICAVDINNNHLANLFVIGKEGVYESRSVAPTLDTKGYFLDTQYDDYKGSVRRVE